MCGQESDGDMPWKRRRGIPKRKWLDTSGTTCRRENCKGMKHKPD